MTTTHYRLLGSLLLVLSLAACSPTRYFAGSAPSELALLDPVTYISHVERNGELVPNDSLSIRSAEMLTRVFTSIGLPVARIVPVDYWGNEGHLLPFLEQLPAVDVRQLKRSPVPEPIRQLLQEHGQRYGLLVYADGFTRDELNYAKGVAVGAALGVLGLILSGGHQAHLNLPNKFGSHIFVMVVDAEANQVVFYNKSTPDEANPMSEKQLRQQVRKLMQTLL